MRTPRCLASLLASGSALLLLSHGTLVGGGTSRRLPTDIIRGSSPPTKAKVGDKAVMECELDLPLASLRQGGGRLELAWNMQDPDTDENHVLARYSHSLEDFPTGGGGGPAARWVAGSGPRVAASWEAPRWSLHLVNVSREDGGYYDCQVLLDGSLLTSREILFSVSSQKVEQTATYVIKKAGGNVTLDCLDLDQKQLGDDTQMTVWRKEGDSKVVQSGSQLKLIRVDREDSGVYYCSVSGGVAKNFTLRVDHAPIATALETVVKQTVGNAVELRCNISSLPVSLVRWFRLGAGPPHLSGPPNSPSSAREMRAGRGVELSLDNFQSGRATYSLRFANLSLADYGTYSCNASNDLGKDSAVLSLESSSSAGIELGLLVRLVIVLHIYRQLYVTKCVH